MASDMQEMVTITETQAGEIEVALECLNGMSGECRGQVEYRMPLSGTGRSFPRCDAHWQERLDREQELLERYPVHPPSDWSPLDAGEAWGEDDR